MVDNHPPEVARRLSLLVVLGVIGPPFAWLIWTSRFHLIGNQILFHALVASVLFVAPILFLLGILTPLASLVARSQNRAVAAGGLAVVYTLVAWLLLVYPAAVTVNCCLDREEPSDFRGVVNRKWEQRGSKAMKYYLEIKPAADGVQPMSLRVSFNEYNAAVPGASQASMALHPGRLGYAWYSGLKVQ